MTKTNGRHDPNDVPQVASLDEARRAAQKKVKAEQRAAAGLGGERTARDWLIGGVLIAMAIGMIVHWVVSIGTPPPAIGNVQKL